MRPVCDHMDFTAFQIMFNEPGVCVRGEWFEVGSSILRRTAVSPCPVGIHVHRTPGRGGLLSSSVGLCIDESQRPVSIFTAALRVPIGVKRPTIGQGETLPNSLPTK